MTEQTLTRADWRRIAISGYLPTTLSSIGFGAIAPLVALSATRLGASLGLAALIVGLIGIATLVGDLPAGWVASRFGEKRAIVGSCLIDAVSLGVAFFATNLYVLGAAVFCTGLTGAVFGLARQKYLTDVVPLQFRARALSTLGGTFRVGFFVGPLVGAALVAAWGLPAGYAFASAISFAAAIATMWIPDLKGTDAARAARGEHPKTATVLRQHSHTLLTLGVGVLAVTGIRTARQAIIPLWCEAHGLSPTTTSLIFAVSMGFDLALFFPGGLIMDRLGRFWTSVPAMAVMGVGLLVLPLSHTALSITLVSALLGIGNGISSGVVMTLGSDASPEVGRAQFLAGWRLIADSGGTAGPLIISAVSYFAPLAAASITLGVLAWAGAGWLARWVPRGRPGSAQ